MLRHLVRHPAAALPAIVVVALAVGVSTALFSYLSAMLWPRVDAPEPHRLVNVYFGTRNEPRAQASFRELQLLRERREGFDAVIGYSPHGASLEDGERTRFGWAYAVSAGYFELLGARPLLGRLLQPADDRPGAPVVVVLHPSFWRARFGGDRGVVGRTLRVNGIAATIVGIAPEGFQGHGHAGALYYPLAQADAVSGVPRLGDPEKRFLQVMGRLAPGWTPERLRASLLPLAQAADRETPLEDGARQMAVVPTDRYDDGWGPDPYLTPARALFACALLFLLLAAASVANLQLARAALRRREWTIRAALGESRRRLAARALGDAAVLCAIGALLGLPLAVALASRLETWTLTSPVAGWSDWSRLVRFDARTAAFAFAATLGCAVVAGGVSLLPLLRRERALLGLRGAAGEAAGLGGRRALVALQLALSLALCLAGGLLARSLLRASAVDAGYSPDHLFLATLYAPRNLDGGTPARLYERLRVEVERVPGVESASLAHVAPFSMMHRPAEVARSDRPEDLRHAAYDLVATGYFDALGVRLVAGRALDRRDAAESAPAVVVAEPLAVELWGSAAAAVGRQVVSPGSPHEAWTVVGVAPRLRAGPPDEPAPPAVYFPLAQRPHSRASLLLRSRLPLRDVNEQVRAALRRVHPGLALVELTTGDEARRALLTPQRLRAAVASLYALLGLAIATVGLFGLLSQAVVSGTRELAVRLAVGAGPRDLLRLVVSNALRMLAAGALVGVALWIPFVRLLRGMLFGVGALDTATLVAAPALLALAALAAALLPALRAARTDPATALRQD
jgi:putative ABC transport system permease protein